MSFSTRLLATRKRAVPAGAALMVGLLGSSGAWAQCVDNGLPPGFAGALLPFGTGGSVNSLVSVINTVNTAFLTNTTAFVSAPGGVKPNQQGGGAWGRVIAGTADTEATGVTTVVAGGVPVAGNQTCNTTTRQNYSGFQVGQDISILNGGATGANFHVGLTAGYFAADAKDITPGGTFRGNTEVPFAGLYAAFTKGGFFADGQVRLDAYQNEITDAANNIAGQQFNARGLSLTGNLGYNIPLHNNWFIEPSGGVVWSRVKIDPIDVAGPSIAGVFQVPGNVQIDDVESLLGRASVRVGTNFTSGHMAWQPFFTASVIHEFAGDVATRLTPSGGVFFGIVDSGTLTTSRIGTYGQFGLGTAAVVLNTGWLGYARADYRTGENIESWSVNAGLRYQFTPAASRGSVKDGAASTASDTYKWTGLYVGAYTGKTWGGQDWLFLDAGTNANPIFGGYVLGGTVGYNVQFGNMVLGVEGDFGDANGKGARSCPNAFFNCEAELNSLGSVTGRVGVTAGRGLFYVKGGLAMGEVGAGTFLKAFPAPPAGAIPVTSTNWQTGWTAGAGMEFAIADRWSAKGELLYYDLGKDTFRTYIFPGDTGLVDAETSGRVVRVGVNYHFHRQPNPQPLK